MNAYAVFVVTEHLETLRREAAERRLANETRPTVSARIAARMAGLRSLFRTSYAASDPIIPRLDGYPYRG